MEINRKYKLKRNISIILFIFAGFWFVGAISWIFIYQPIQIDKTAEYRAKIQNINPVGFYQITTENYNAQFYIYYKDTIIDLQTLNNLNIGDEIVLRIRNKDKTKLQNNSEIIEIITLSKDEMNIITIDSYNKNNKKMRGQASLGFAFAGLVCLVIATILIVLCKKQKKDVS